MTLHNGSPVDRFAVQQQASSPLRERRRGLDQRHALDSVDMPRQFIRQPAGRAADVACMMDLDASCGNPTGALPCDLDIEGWMDGAEAL